MKFGYFTLSDNGYRDNTRSANTFVADIIVRLAARDAGFTTGATWDINGNLTVGGNVSSSATLIVTGKTAEDAAQSELLYRGIAGRAFERVFQLADFVVVKTASLENGLLHVDLVREIPEAKKPRSIPITSTAPTAQVVDSGVEKSAEKVAA